MRIEEQDERNLLLAYKSGYFSMLISIMIMYAVSIVLALSGSKLVSVITAIIGLQILIYIISYYVLRRVK
jgi:ABC-type molybdate transport system permease subunit